ncbi:hypothetical protein [Flavihumibacter profundi]|uniref:hypothetical protein n=1 Tax=Flavihumibacter profundi TaxID=2716883 RepID=UPI001CC38FDF|nr:hypothetical protein [Flavihumibacter profundi]MBZ5859426.1 hypothetical protein [Flavihumibacter profundi]
MKHYNDLGEKERAQLLKFPAYISLLASTAANGIDKKEKKAVVKLTHIKTFSCDPLLADFYKEAEQGFEKTITDLDNELPRNKEERTISICQELNKLEPILKKLEPRYVTVLRHSMESYKQHISKAHHNILEYFIFPIPIDGISY